MFPHPSIPVTMTLLVLLGTFTLPCHNLPFSAYRNKAVIFGHTVSTESWSFRGLTTCPYLRMVIKAISPITANHFHKPIVGSHKVMWSIMDNHSLTAYCRQPQSHSPSRATIVMRPTVGNHGHMAHRGQPSAHSPSWAITALQLIVGNHSHISRCGQP